MSFAKKLSISYLIVVFIPMLAGWLFFTNYVSKSVREEYLNGASNNIRQINYTVSEKIAAAFQVGKAFASDSKLNLFLQSKDLDDKEIVETINKYIITWITSVKLQNPSIYKIRLLHGNETIYDVAGSILYYGPVEMAAKRKAYEQSVSIRDIDYLKYYKVYVEYSHRERIYPPRYSTVGSTVSNTTLPSVHTLYFPIRNSGNPDQHIGIVEIDLLDDTLFSPFQELKLASQDIVLLTTGDGKVLYSSKAVSASIEIQKFKSGDKYELFQINGANYYAVREYNKYLDTWLIQLVSPQSILNVNNFRVLLIVGLIVALVTLGGISLILSRRLVDNLVRLTGAMNSVRDGDFTKKVPVTSKDEIGELALNFNKMTDRMNVLMGEIEKANKAEKEAIYKALENQIKPHFLCNALDMVRMTAETQNSSEISSALETIINYFMYNLAKRDKYVSIEDELRNVLNYIEIHNMIRSNKIEYEVHIAGELNGKLGEYSILKFTLQPLAENSIKHAFRNRNTNCQLRLEITCNDRMLTVVLEDNGAGISPQRLAELERHLDLNSGGEPIPLSGTGIGLRNIKERIRMNDGDDCSLELESYEGVGTRVVLTVPLRKTG